MGRHNSPISPQPCSLAMSEGLKAFCNRIKVIISSLSTVLFVLFSPLSISFCICPTTSLSFHLDHEQAKGLQKLRWYCQMCQKQCRDENGMKCHMKSESHLRQMKIFAENPDHILSQFSKDFEKTFLDVLNHKHGTKRVHINKVYKEYIADKHHVHMNSTQWTTLTGFAKYLGKEGKVINSSF